jgi:hypothetical protein
VQGFLEEEALGLDLEGETGFQSRISKLPMPLALLAYFSRLLATTCCI